MRIAAFVFASLVTPLLAQQDGATEGSWLTDFEAAKATAKKEKKVILADFTGSDWCGWCIKLDEEVFSQPEFQDWAAKKVVLLKLDFPRKTKLSPELQKQNEQLQKQFDIQGFPTILFLDADGKKLGETGYQEGGPTKWIAAAEAQMGGKAADDAWMTDYKAALAKAKKEKKFVLADFTGSDWCGWCIKLDDEVFSKPEFQEWADANVVLLKLDFPRKTKLSPELQKQNEELQKEFDITGFPTILFLDAKGKKVDRSGYMEGGPEAWIADAEKKMGIKGKKKKKAKKD